MHPPGLGDRQGLPDVARASGLAAVASVGRMTGGRTLWIDATAGLAGDMLVAALVDAGASRAAVESAVAAVVPEVRLSWATVSRAGIRALRFVVAPGFPSPTRHLADILDILASAALPAEVEGLAIAVVKRLGAAEAAVHDVPVETVHFHEVGAWDSLADIVGGCAALVDLGVPDVRLSTVALGSGRVATEHGDLPVPAPAVAQLARGWIVSGEGQGESTTPTGLALATTWACLDVASSPPDSGRQGPMPLGRLVAVGMGAGARDVDGRPNVVRAVVLDRVDEDATSSETLVELAANVDDLDPRVWPTVLAALLDAGALDAWLSPTVMKKGRPGHTLHALTSPARARDLVDLVVRHTTTLGVRATVVERTAVARGWVDIDVLGRSVRVKVAHRAGRVLGVTPEFDDAERVAREGDVPVRHVLGLAAAAATAAGIVLDAPVPPGLRPEQPDSAGTQAPPGGSGSAI